MIVAGLAEEFGGGLEWRVLLAGANLDVRRRYHFVSIGDGIPTEQHFNW